MLLSLQFRISDLINVLLLDDFLVCNMLGRSFNAGIEARLCDVLCNEIIKIFLKDFMLLRRTSKNGFPDRFPKIGAFIVEFHRFRVFVEKFS